MKRIGLTGGIGSGKSTVAKLFVQLGVPVFNSDDVARKLQDEDPVVKEEIAAIFNHEVYKDGKLDRAKVAEIVFTDKKKLDQLNMIVHPAVAEAFKKFCEKNKTAKYILKEAAILFETGDDKNLDGMILVTAPEEVRVQRVMKRDNVSEDAVLNRMRNQWKEEFKIENSKFIIQNDGKEMILPQVVKVNEELSA